MWYLIVGAALLWLIYRKWTSVYSYWESKGIPTLPGSFPLGSKLSYELMLTRTYAGHIFDKIYKASSPHPYIGVYDVRLAALVLRDPEIIRLVMAKDFSHFRDRNGIDIPEKQDPLSSHLFMLEGDRWRALRVKMSPTFTSGKIKAMFPLFIRCAQALESAILAKAESAVDMKVVSARFTTDLICSCAFGLDVDCCKNEDSEFLKIGMSFFKVRPIMGLLMFFLKISPKFLELTKFRLTPRDVEDFIMKVVRETVEHREKNNLKRNDFLDLLIEIKNKGSLSDGLTDPDDERHGQSFELTFELLAAQCFVFFLAGFETSSSVQAYCLYELALHPDLQERLQEEIDEVLAKHGDLTYEAIQEMHYLDMVVSETMRKYPTLPFLTRRCTRAYRMPGGHRIDKGDRILIPVWSLHHDPQYFPDPERFDPERFSPENKDSIKPFTYLPFGEGPRICIGMRFGLLQTKVGLITILRKFSVVPTEKTPIPLTFAGGVIFTMSKDPIFLCIKKRDGSTR